MENFKFVFLNSASLVPFAIGFLLLGFLHGFFHWRQWTRELKSLQKESEELKHRVKSEPIRLGSAADLESKTEEFKFNNISFDN